MLLMSSHNICFYGEIRKISQLFGWRKHLYLELLLYLIYIALEEAEFCWEYVDILLIFFNQNIYCGYLLELPHWGCSSECPQYMIWWRIKKVKKIKILLLSGISLYDFSRWSCNALNFTTFSANLADDKLIFFSENRLRYFK